MVNTVITNIRTQVFQCGCLISGMFHAHTAGRPPVTPRLPRFDGISITAPAKCCAVYILESATETTTCFQNATRSALKEYGGKPPPSVAGIRQLFRAMCAYVDTQNVRFTNKGKWLTGRPIISSWVRRGKPARSAQHHITLVECSGRGVPVNADADYLMLNAFLEMMI